MKIIICLLVTYLVYAVICCISVMPFTNYDIHSYVSQVSDDKFIVDEVTKGTLYNLFLNVSHTIEDMCQQWREPPFPEPQSLDLWSSCALNNSLKHLNEILDQQEKSTMEDIKSFYVFYFNSEESCNYNFVEDTLQKNFDPKSRTYHYKFKIPSLLLDLKENEDENTVTKVLENIVVWSLRLLDVSLSSVLEPDNFNTDEMTKKIELMKASNDSDLWISTYEDYASKVKIMSLKTLVTVELVHIQRKLAGFDYLLCVSINSFKILSFNNFCVMLFMLALFNIGFIIVMNQYSVVPFAICFATQSCFAILCTKLKTVFGKMVVLKNNLWTLVALESFKARRPKMLKYQGPTTWKKQQQKKRRKVVK